MLAAFTERAEDVLLFARCLCVNGEHERAVRVLQTRNLLDTKQGPDPEAALIAAAAYNALSKHEQSVKLLQRVLDTPQSSESTATTTGALWLLRGKANLALERRHEAVRCLQAALEHDPLCEEAWHLLASTHALAAAQWEALYADTKARMAQCIDSVAAEMLLTFYAAATAEAGTAISKAAAQHLERHSGTAAHPESATTKARLLLAARRHDEALDAINKFATRKQQHRRQRRTSTKQPPNRGTKKEGLVCADTEALLVYLACLLQLEKNEELARAAEDLSSARPGEPITWYAVGCFWVAQKEYEAARTCFAFVHHLHHKHRAAAAAQKRTKREQQTARRQQRSRRLHARG